MMLRPYQEIGRDFLASRTRALLADEMRVGKTPQAIAAADKINAKRVLAVCPAIAVPHWQSQWKLWSPDRPKAYALSSASPKFNASLTVASYAMAARWQEELAAQEWDALIVDECHFAKNPEAVRTKIIYGKDSLGWSSNYIWALSGTPAPRHAGELWPMLVAFGIVKMTYWEFLERYCVCDRLSGRVFGTKERMILELRTLMAPIMLRRKRKDVAPDMPEIGFDFLEVEPGAVPQSDVPNLPDVELLSWLEANRVAQRKARQDVAAAKAKPLADEVAFAIENKLLAQTVVFGFHVAPLEDVVSRLRERGISAALINGATSAADRVAIQESFSYNRVSVLVANIIAAGTAIDLSAASHAYFLELDWVPGNNVQAANRLVSMDKQTPVTVDVVTWPGSTDDKVQQVLVRRARELAQLY